MDDLKKLADPFPASDIEWRIQRAGVKNNRPWAIVLAYITARAIMNRLDAVCGPENWQDEYKPGPDGGVICGISVRTDNGWVTKWDGGENTKVERVKGGLSVSFKRAGAKWGIGRYLYELENDFAEIAEDDRAMYQGVAKRSADDKQGMRFWWNPPKLPAWALPEQKGIKPHRINDELKERMKKAADSGMLSETQLRIFRERIRDAGDDMGEVSEIVGQMEAEVNLSRKNAAGAQTLHIPEDPRTSDEIADEAYDEQLEIF